MKYFYNLLGLIFLTLTFNQNARATDGDPRTIFAHQEVHWDWNGNFYDTVSFPTGNTYQKVIMHYVLGYPSNGCSD